MDNKIKFGPELFSESGTTSKGLHYDVLADNDGHASSNIDNDPEARVQLFEAVIAILKGEKPASNHQDQYAAQYEAKKLLSVQKNPKKAIKQAEKDLQEAKSQAANIHKISLDT